MKYLEAKDVDGFLASVGEKMFSVSFIKTTGELRAMTCRVGVHNSKDFPIVGSGRPRAAHVRTVFEMPNVGYRSFDVNRVITLQCGGLILGPL